MPATVETNDTNTTSTASMSTAMQKRATGAYSFLHRSLDAYLPPSMRKDAYDAVTAFASERPILFAFLVAQALLASIPLLLFATFSINTLLFALSAALIFTLFWIGIALLVLVPTLLLTSSLAVLLWAWAVGSFLLARAIYQRAPCRVNGELHADTSSK